MPTTAKSAIERRDEDVVPVCLFAYARPEHLRRTLACLQRDAVSLIYAFSDGPRTPGEAGAVVEVRQILRAVDWCQVVLEERTENWGLGRSILAGVTEALGRHRMVVVFEDDLVCVPGTYPYLVAGLHRYRGHPAVMSVTGWTHPRVAPGDVGGQPYFDGRAECWSWGTWARVWEGMDRDALTLMQECRRRGIDVYRYGADLPEMAEMERGRNLWAARWSYLHLLRGGLCLRPPHTLVEHAGFDPLATNAAGGSRWANPPMRACPPLPETWPVPVEHPQCARLWQAVCGHRPGVSTRLLGRGMRWLRRSLSPRSARA